MVAEGRRVVNDVEQGRILYIVKNIFSHAACHFLRDSDAGLSTGTITGIAVLISILKNVHRYEHIYIIYGI